MYNRKYSTKATAVTNDRKEIVIYEYLYIAGGEYSEEIRIGDKVYFCETNIMADVEDTVDGTTLPELEKEDFESMFTDEPTKNMQEALEFIEVKKEDIAYIVFETEQVVVGDFGNERWEIIWKK